MFVGLDAAFWRHERRVGENDIRQLVPALLLCEAVVFVDVWIGEAVQLEVHQREPHHVGADVVTFEVLRELAFIIGRELAVPFGVPVAAQDVLVGGDEEPGGAAGGVEDGFVLLGLQDLDHEVDDVARGAELPGIALAAEHGEQVFKGIAEALAVVVAELVDDFQEGIERLGVAVRQVGVLEDVAEQSGQALILRHAGDSISVAAQLVVPGLLHELCPPVSGELALEELPLPAELLRLGVHVVHELVDEGDGDLLDLGLRIGDLAHEDVTGGVDAAFGVGVEHSGKN